MKSMKVITIWQPYATLLVRQEFKHFETRGWATNYTGPIAIHAAQRPVDLTMRKLPMETREVIKGCFPGPDYLRILPTGAIVGIGFLERCNAITDDFAASLSREERCLGDYSPGRFAWEFSSMEQIVPIFTPGKQGLWNWEGLHEH